MAVMEKVSKVLNTPSYIVMEIIRYHQLDEQQKKDYKVLSTIERVLPSLYFWLLIQMYIAIVIFM